MATRRAYAGAAAATTLSAGISNVDTSISITAATGWPSGNPFFAVIEPGLAGEEKILCTRSGTTLTASARGADNTSAASHSSGVEIYPCLTATDLDEANRLAAAMTTQGDIIIADASGNPIRLARGTTGQVLEATASTVAWGQVDTAGIADDAVTLVKLAADVDAIVPSGILTTKGDLLGRSATVPARIAVGADGAFLVADATQANGVRWDTTPEPFYRTGTWSAQLDQGGTVAATVNESRYTRVGDLVTISARLTATAAGTAGNPIIVKNLPFTVAAANGVHAGAMVHIDGADRNTCLVLVGSTTTNVRFQSTIPGFTDYYGTTNGGSFTLANTDQIFVAFSYYTNDA